MEAVEKQSGISQKKLKRIIIALLILFVLIFILMYFLNRDVWQKINNNLPFSSEPSFLFAIYGSGLDGALKNPMGVYVANDKIYITDTGNSRVQIFDYEGNFIKKFGAKGTNEGQFRFPYGIAVDKSGNIYVADLYEQKVSIFDQNGKFKKYFGSPKKDYVSITAMHIDGDKLYMADINDGKIKIFDLTGKKLKEFGQLGVGKGQFLSPNGVFVLDGKIYVSEAKNQRVQVFDQNGKYLLTFEERDPSDKTKKTSYLINPRGIGIDGKGQVYVTSKISSNVHIYNTKGKHKGTFGSLGQEDEQFNLPNGLFVDDQGRIYITDTANNRVDVYEN